jgi:hypothetical protein
VNLVPILPGVELAPILLKKEMGMCNLRFRRRSANLAIVMLVGLGSISTTESAFAQYRHQVNQMCQDRVKAKGLKGDSWKAEYQKCKLDPIGYK